MVLKASPVSEFKLKIYLLQRTRAPSDLLCKAGGSLFRATRDLKWSPRVCHNSPVISQHQSWLLERDWAMLRLSCKKIQIIQCKLEIGWEKDHQCFYPPDFDLSFWQHFGFIFPSSGHNGKHRLFGAIVFHLLIPLLATFKGRLQKKKMWQMSHQDWPPPPLI